MYLVLLIVITLNRAIMISLSWYHNHFKYLQIQKMITVINTSDKRINNEIFQNCRGITWIHRSPSRPRPSVRLTAILINIHEHLIKGLVKASRQTVN